MYVYYVNISLFSYCTAMFSSLLLRYSQVKALALRIFFFMIPNSIVMYNYGDFITNYIGIDFYQPKLPLDYYRASGPLHVCKNF